MPVSLNLNQIEIKNGQQYTPIVAVGSGDYIENPANPSVGDFLVYTSTGWDALPVSMAQGASF